MAYRRPAVLGDQLTVHTTPFEDGSSNHAQTIERDGVQLMTVRRTSDEEVTPSAAQPHPIFGKVSTYRCSARAATTIWTDGTAGCPSIPACGPRAVAQYLPRRTGPAKLHYQADGMPVVVAGVDGLRHATVPANIGDTVEVIADVSQVKTRIVFDQYVAVNGAPAAFARISCVCVDVIRGRPVAPPDVVVSVEVVVQEVGHGDRRPGGRGTLSSSSDRASRSRSCWSPLSGPPRPEAAPWPRQKGCVGHRRALRRRRCHHRRPRLVHQCRRLNAGARWRGRSTASGRAARGPRRRRTFIMSPSFGWSQGGRGGRSRPGRLEDRPRGGRSPTSWARTAATTRASDAWRLGGGAARRRRPSRGGWRASSPLASEVVERHQTIVAARGRRRRAAGAGADRPTMIAAAGAAPLNRAQSRLRSATREPAPPGRTAS